MERRYVHREPIDCCFSVDIFLFPHGIVHFRSSTRYVFHYTGRVVEQHARSLHIIRKSLIGCKSWSIWAENSWIDLNDELNNPN